jgi:glycosyltransferase involved in cell wall biosynthesis
MRVLYDCLVELDLPDGHALHTRQLCEGLAAAGIEVELFGPRSLYRPERPGLGVVGIPFAGYSSIRLRAYRLVLRRRMIARIAARRPDIIVHKLSQSLPTVVDVARDARLPLAIELNGTLGAADSWDERMIRSGLRATTRLPRVLLLGVSPELGERYRDELGAAEVDFRWFENGVDRALFAAPPARRRAELGIPEDAFLIGYIGSANPKYDFDTLFAGARLARAQGLEVAFLVVAPPAVAARVRELGERFGLDDCVVTRDLVPHAEVPGLLGLLDCGMVLLRDEDAHMAPTALKLKEMLLAGVPCLVNVPPSWAGWPLAAPVRGLAAATPEAVRDRLLAIAREPGEERTRLARAREIIETEYDWTQVARRYAAALSDHISDPESTPSERSTAPCIG